jgi:hypothetical protein
MYEKKKKPVQVGFKTGLNRFVSHSIRKMKKELQRYQIEQERIFIQLEDDKLFTEDFHHIMQYYRLRKARSNRPHPYRRPSTTTRPRSRSSNSSGRSVVILSSDADALISQPPSSSSSNSTSFHSVGEGPSGTRGNPIVYWTRTTKKYANGATYQDTTSMSVIRPFARSPTAKLVHGPDNRSATTTTFLRHGSCYDFFLFVLIMHASTTCSPH